MNIEVNDLSISFAGQYALQSFSIRISSEKTTVVLGSSGSGKSTFVKALLGLYPRSSGQITIDGRILEGNSLPKFRESCGYLTQKGGLFPHITLRDNICLQAQNQGISEKKIVARLKELADLTNLASEILDRYPGEVSGGQLQRAALMRALFIQPRLLILDEPLSALDPIIRYELREQLRKIFKQLKLTVIVITHDLNIAKALADQVVLLNRGRQIQIGSFEQLRNNPTSAFVERFFKAQQ